MSTITLWLLVSVGSMYSGSHSAPSIVVERFTSQGSCELVIAEMKKAAGYGKPQIACIRAEVYKP